MVYGRLETFFRRLKERLETKLKSYDIVKFAAKEAAGAIPVVGRIIKDFFDELSEDEKKALIKELKELSETQLNEISEKIGLSVEYLIIIREITLYSFGELRKDHEEIKELIQRLINEIQPSGIGIPTIQSVLRKGETTEGDFFKKEPEWIDFEEGFIVERKEVNEIINALANDNIQLVLGEPASGKSIILKNIGFKLAKEGRDVYMVELKKHSKDGVNRYFEAIPGINDEEPVFIVDDAHLFTMECERLVRDFKNMGLKSKLIIGSRPASEIIGEHPKEASAFEYLSKTEIHAADVTEEMIRSFLANKYSFSDERIETVSGNLKRYKKDLWLLSWALKAYDPDKDTVEEEEIYEKIKESIRHISTGKDKPELNAEDVFLPMAVFYRFEIPIERRFLEDQLRIDKNLIDKLVSLSEIIETEEIGKRVMLSLHHSSIAELYFGAYNAYPSLGEEIRRRIHIKKDDIEYSLFYSYLKSSPTNTLDVVIRLAIDWFDEKVRTILKELVGNGTIIDIIKERIEREGDIGEIGTCVGGITIANKEVAMEFINRLNPELRERVLKMTR